MIDNSLLLELGVPFRRMNGTLLVEAQALNGLRLWSRHFERVTVCAVEQPELDANESSIVWADPALLVDTGKVHLEPLPCGYHPLDHFRFVKGVRDRFKVLIDRHRYLCFSNLGVFGTWGNVAAAEADKRHRPYSLWFDWVLHGMAPERSRGLLARAKDSTMAAIVKHKTRRALRASSLGLFHGKTVYDAYAPWCRQAELVHDVHIHPEDGIEERRLLGRLDSLAHRPALRIGYVGRVHPMKAPFDWINALASVVAAVGPDAVDATWLGDGPLLTESRQRVQELGLSGTIRFTGFVSDREQLLEFLREQDVFAFCHVTPESPRCLIEALISGVPIIGYDSAYARDLVDDRGGAMLSPVGEPLAMAANLIRLVRDRITARQLALAAATARAIYSDEAVFAHRSELIKRHLKALAP